MKINEIIIEGSQCSLLERPWNGEIVYSLTKKTILQAWVEIYHHFNDSTGYHTKKVNLSSVKLILALTLENLHKVLIQTNKKKLKESSSQVNASTLNFLKRTFFSLWKTIRANLINSDQKDDLFKDGEIDPRNSLQIIFNILRKSHSDLQKLITTKTKIISTDSDISKPLPSDVLALSRKIKANEFIRRF